MFFFALFEVACYAATPHQTRRKLASTGFCKNPNVSTEIQYFLVSQAHEKLAKKQVAASTPETLDDILLGLRPWYIGK